MDLYAGLRYDDYKGDRMVDAVTGYNANAKPLGFEDRKVDFHEGVVQPKLGLVYSFEPWLSVYGRAARAARFPDNPAFYWYYAGYQPELDFRTNVTRKDLTYEDAMQYEAGAQYSGLKNFTVSATVYHYRVDDYIRWIFGYAPSRVVYNGSGCAGLMSGKCPTWPVKAARTGPRSLPAPQPNCGKWMIL
jgi:outer membrane receptor protein involved in Fe transport